MWHCGRDFDAATILERRRDVSTERMPWGNDELRQLLLTWGVVVPEPSREKGAWLCDHGCARPLPGSTLSARPGSFHALGGAAGRFLLLGPRCRRRVLLLPADDGGGEEGRRMFLNKKLYSVPQLKTETHNSIGGPAFFIQLE